ncbi:fructose-1,6-bisphosphatase class 1/Sedoheputulose-1,7-bisphosphatase [Kockiozyma suomiensis]|uniref:fructose-1,6-bisphosphatase class 1/Sedoheputulose-1,7-bisphosphatase n=1 Tax=Kockiozyma suomiensis TaxID=1337062 RepID=UPI0033442301
MSNGFATSGPDGGDAINEIKTDIVTLTRFILDEQSRVQTETTGDFTLLLNSLQFAFKFISHNIRRATLVNLIGLAGATNSTGDDQKKLDVIGDEIFINAMRASGKVKVLVSEEQDEIIVFDGDGKYCVVCDPIDGSSNLDAGVSVGTIFGVYKIQPGSSGTVADVLRPGTEMVAAGYTMYGASANLVLTTGNGVNGFTLDSALGEFILTHPDMKIPKKRAIYSANEGNTVFWDKPTQEYFHSLKYPAEGSKPYSARYIGSMVADMHRTLLYGGIFAYPADSKSKNGKLRILYECFPMAFLVEQAGGLATDGRKRILDMVPEHIHSRSGIFLGSELEVQKVIDSYKKHDA